ncbi:hypothetical protein J5E42_08030 [Mammaliicoccus vitulinus]|uniref:hypothetical protein n=1 Tax=Mammaliicoccus vitulinus TaxID=71237 RepID=UPI0002F9D279|nr:hypothetical protein [Mammaliicoccus vitulinus]MBO3077470.1 hypothetical protein [Mammaliicoccus vitulinus]
MNSIIILLKNEKVKLQDISSLLIFMYFFNVITSIVYFIGPMISTVFIMIQNYIITIYKSAINLQKGLNQIYIDRNLYNNTYINNIEQSLYSVLPFLFLSIFSLIIAGIILVLFKVQNILIKLNIFIVSNILINMFFYHEFILPIILTIFLLIILSLFIPLGSGFYCSRLKEIYYLVSMSKIEKPAKKKMVAIILISILFVLVFILSMPQISILIPLTILVAILLLISNNNQKNKSEKLIVKLTTYIVFIPVIIVYNVKNEISIISILMVAILVYFSIERIISTFDEIIKELHKNSVEFNYNEIKNINFLVKYLIDLDVLKNNIFDEEILVNQIIKYFEVQNYNACVELVDIYLENYSSQKYHDIAIYYLYIIKYQNINNKECYEFLKENLKIKNQKIVPIDLIEEYALLMQDFDEIKEDVENILINNRILLSNRGKKLIEFKG